MSRRRARARVRLRHALGLALVGPALAACQTWRMPSVAPQTLIEGERPRVVRATLDDGRVLTLTQPVIVSDTIVGTTLLGLERAPMSQLRSLEVRRTSVPRTLALIVTHVSAVVTAIAVIIEIQPHYRGF